MKKNYSTISYTELLKRLKCFLLFLPLVFFVQIANAQYAKLYDFATVPDGNNPQGDLVSDGTFLYGMTLLGGANDDGIIFKIKPDGTSYSKLLDFEGINGNIPHGSLIFDGNFLYGMTTGGGTGLNGTGIIFKIKTDGTGYGKLLDFSGANGSLPNSSLFSDGNFLYGTTNAGGLNNLGTVFKIKTDGTGYTDLLDFSGTANGSGPDGSLISDGTFLYGMTVSGGANTSCSGGCGTIFKMMSDGTGYSKLIDFNGITNGGTPNGSLIYDGSFLYGMTINGGVNNMGTIFRIRPDGTGDTILLNFSGVTNGGQPYGSLISDGTFLYGMTGVGGVDSLGIIFKIKSDGTGYTDLLDFSFTNGAYPNGSLISDGTFLYGMTSYGGATGNGVIFKYHPTGMGIAEYNAQIDFTISPNPTSGVFNVQINKSENLQMKIYNVIGECIYRQIGTPANQQIDLSAAKNGVYFLQLKTSDGIATKKIVINK